MCYFCNSRHTRVPFHYGINCRSKKNKYSAHNVKGISNKYCKRCRRRTHHFWHQANGYEPKFL